MADILLRLKDIRLEKGKQQKEIAEILGLSKQVYNRYELGERAIPLEMLWKLADYYNVTIDYLVGRSEY